MYKYDLFQIFQLNYSDRLNAQVVSTQVLRIESFIDMILILLESKILSDLFELLKQLLFSLISLRFKYEYRKKKWKVQIQQKPKW